MKELISKEEQGALTLLKAALSKENEIKIDNNVDSNMLLGLTKKHAIVSLIYDVVMEKGLFPEHQIRLEKETKQIVLQSYRLLFLTKYVMNLLDAQGIKTVVLKGVATASFYPVPELRKSGDVDLLLPEKVDEKKLVDIMTAAGFQVSKDQHANHHMVFVSQEGICIELHQMLAEPFAYKKINRAMEKQMQESSRHIIYADVMGVMLPVLDKVYHAYELLLHMLQHFMYAGFGLKLLCDWVMLWKQEWLEEEKQVFRQILKESDLEKFAEGITAVCIKYLGLGTSDFAWSIEISDTTDLLLRELLDSEEFGNSDNNRMVMMNGTGILAYVKEFHHQMHLNFPKAGKCFLLWPVLWIATLVRFLRNNKRVRNTSAQGVLKEAKRRSELMKQLRLFHSV